MRHPGPSWAFEVQYCKLVELQYCTVDLLEGRDKPSPAAGRTARRRYYDETSSAASARSRLVFMGLGGASPRQGVAVSEVPSRRKNGRKIVGSTNRFLPRTAAITLEATLPSGTMPFAEKATSQTAASADGLRGSKGWEHYQTLDPCDPMLITQTKVGIAGRPATFSAGIAEAPGTLQAQQRKKPLVGGHSEYGIEALKDFFQRRSRQKILDLFHSHDKDSSGDMSFDEFCGTY